MLLLKIGLTQGTATEMPYPDHSGVDEDDVQNVILKRSNTGQANITYSSERKKDYFIRFQEKTKAEFDQLKAWCAFTQPVYVEYTNGTVTMMSGWYLLKLDTGLVTTAEDADNLTYNFAINFINL